MKSLICVLGTSGTGKGTRVRQLLEFLKIKFKYRVVKSEELGLRKVIKKTKGQRKQDFDSEPVVGKDVGILFYSSVGTIFIVGTFVISNKSKLESWNSIDYIHSICGKVELGWEFVKNAIDNFGNVVIEGYPLMNTFRYRPKYLMENVGVDSLMYQFYCYNDINEYYNRILQRSGKLPKGLSAWKDNEQFCERLYGRVVKEASSVDIPVVVFRDSYDVSVESLGKRMLEFWGLSHLISEFELYSEEVKWLRSVDSVEYGGQ